MPGLHINDHQMRLFMSIRLTHTTAVAAAKAGFRTVTDPNLVDISVHLKLHLSAVTRTCVSLFYAPPVT